MPANYYPILVFILLAGAFPVVALLLSRVIRPSKPTKEKLEPYECGIVPTGDSRGRYTIRYYIVAILFVIFDVETVFLFPWAIRFQLLRVFGLIEMAVFLGILVVGYVWLYKKGALDWI
jgi:NADH-quinone oxidoreductase subunit A